MGFYIKYREMQEYYEQVKQWAESVQGILCDLYKRWERLEKEEKMQGGAADAIRVRIEEFHLPVIRGIQLILREFIRKIAAYIQDYYDNIDASPDTVISEDALLEGMQIIRDRMAQIMEIGQN